MSIHWLSAALAWPFLYSLSASTAAAKATTETQYTGRDFSHAAVEHGDGAAAVLLDDRLEAEGLGDARVPELRERPARRREHGEASVLELGLAVDIQVGLWSRLSRDADRSPAVGS